MERACRGHLNQPKSGFGLPFIVAAPHPQCCDAVRRSGTAACWTSVAASSAALSSVLDAGSPFASA